MSDRRQRLISALRATADRLATGAPYQWGHYGSCNCGHLAQTLTGRPPAELHRLAQARDGDWRRQAEEHCTTTGAPLGDVIQEMLAAGLRLEDIAHLEHLSDPRVLARYPGDTYALRRNRREDVVVYMRTWADLLAEEAAPTSVPPRDAPRPLAHRK